MYVVYQSMVGGITQLVECLLCTQEVIGSTPVTSNIFNVAVIPYLSIS